MSNEVRPATAGAGVRGRHDDDPDKEMTRTLVDKAPRQHTRKAVPERRLADTQTDFIMSTESRRRDTDGRRNATVFGALP